ncbi:MAG TPA: tetratricopeptide repeat protein, partial [Chthoniobacterales bacterium]|nr:tetratricopeptide repeat protein [Chthoniobacterales bacterium]
MSRKSQKKVRGGQRTSKTTVLAPRTLAWENWLWGLLLVAATILVYQQVWHAGYIWDDDVYVTENKLLTAPDGLRRIWFSLDSPSQYFPLVYTSFRLEHALWGLYPEGYHWVNILLHTANALLVWRLLVVLRLPGAWLAAAFFALHPVQVESVAWITERKNVLMGLFFLLTLLAWVKFVEGSAKERWKFYGLALVCYALALFSKTTACTLPAALLLVLWLKERRIDWRRLMEIVPFVALGLGMGLVTVWWERFHQGTQGELFQIGVAERFLVASRALWFYLGKLVWPANLVFSYPRWTISAGNPLDYTWLLATAAAVALVYLARRRFGRGPEVAALFFVATLSPVLGFIMLYTFRYSFVADHYQYLACIGPLAVAAAGITIAVDRLGEGKRSLKGAVGGALLAALGLLSWRLTAMYKNSDTLWWTTIDKNPDSWMGHNNIAISLLNAGRVDEAVAHYEKALDLNPT